MRATLDGQTVEAKTIEELVSKLDEKVKKHASKEAKKEER
jgi:hypothetical protein